MLHDSVQVQNLELQQFRCFERLNLHLDAPLVLITGPNGSGKTSVLEALHYLCYLRSFRTPSPRHLVHHGGETFFLKTTIEENESENIEIRAGFSVGKRLVKVNKKSVVSYKELIDHYRVITVNEDDLALIKGEPGGRRLFLNQVIALNEPEYTPIFREYSHLLENRNKLLQQTTLDVHSYMLWSQKLWEKANVIQQKRMSTLAHLAGRTNVLLKNYLGEELSITFHYQSKKGDYHTSFEEFFSKNQRLMDEERRFGRTLFGAHLDDFLIEFQKKRARIFASRGQQKLTLFLIKIALLQELSANRGSCLFLIDDFMTDFDGIRGKFLLDIVINLPNQVIFTSPQRGVLEEMLLEKGGKQIEL